MPRGTYKPEVVVDTSNLKEEEWLDYRRGGIGGSDVSVIFGVSHFRTGRELYYDKLGIKPIKDEEDSTWIQKKMGHLLEDLVAEIFSKKTGLEVFQIKKMFSHPKYPFMRADVDYFVNLPNGKKAILECKTTNYQNRDAWDGEKYPYQYELQIRHYMAVMNIDVVYIACLWGNNENDFTYRKVLRDYDFEDQIIETEENFWEEYIVKEVEPPFVEKPDMALKCLASYIGGADKSAARLDMSKKYLKAIEKYIALKELKQKADAESAKLEEEIKRTYLPIVEEMGARCEAEAKSSSERFLISYKPRKSVKIKREDLDKLKENHPDIYDEYVTESESRTFNVKELKVS